MGTNATGAMQEGANQAGRYIPVTVLQKWQPVNSFQLKAYKMLGNEPR